MIKKIKKADFLKHIDYIYKCAFRYSGNGMDAEDLTQETFYLAYKKSDQLKDRSKGRSWLFMILRNLYIKEFRDKQKFDIIDIENFIEEIPDDAEDNFEMDFTVDELQEGLNVLEEKYKTPLLLFYFSDHSYKEISEILNIPIGTVMSRISRSKIFLRRYMADQISKDRGNIIKFRDNAS